VYEAALAGHPMITTLHSSDPQTNQQRLRQLISDQPTSSDHLILETLTRLFPYSIHMRDHTTPTGSRVYAIESISHSTFDRRSNRIVTKVIAQRTKE
jgi:type II secretory ATPase GspE/PulE/Tfp pilus assembly ATPase PilB-like protein